MLFDIVDDVAVVVVVKIVVDLVVVVDLSIDVLVVIGFGVLVGDGFIMVDLSSAPQMSGLNFQEITSSVQSEISVRVRDGLSANKITILKISLELNSSNESQVPKLNGFRFDSFIIDALKRAFLFD